MSELNREQLKKSLIRWYHAFGELKNYYGHTFDVGGEEERFQQIKSFIEQKPNVSMEFVEKFAGEMSGDARLDNLTIKVYLIAMLKEAGVEVDDEKR